MAEIKEFRLGGAGGYHVAATGFRIRFGVVYERIVLRKDGNGHRGMREWDVTTDSLPRAVACMPDTKFLFDLVAEARKHLAMGSV